MLPFSKNYDNLSNQYSEASLPDKRRCKRRHSCAEGAEFFPIFTALFVLLALAFAALLVFGALLLLNGRYSASGLSAFYGLIIRPFPALSFHNTDRTAALLELMETVYVICGSCCLVLALGFLYGCVVLEQTLFADWPWVRTRWNACRLGWHISRCKGGRLF